jgi:7-cyano-7-deazaguanine synthase
MPEKYTAVLFSGGLDSAVLVADEIRRSRVQPLYVSVGFAWEEEERSMAARFLSHRSIADRVNPMAHLQFDMRDVFTSAHWAVRGEPPAFDTPDDDVFIDGRNLILLSKAGVFMARADISRVLIGPLAGNPFPDATPDFFTAMGRALTLGLAHPIHIDAPLSTLHKADVIRKAVELDVPLELTLSCMQPVNGLHCGRCSKCRERRDAFREAGVDDPTRYREAPIR